MRGKRRKNKVGDVTLLHFKTYYYKAIVVKIVWHKDRHTAHWNRIHPHTYDLIVWEWNTLLHIQPNFNTTYWQMNSLFNKLCWGNWIFTSIRIKATQKLTQNGPKAFKHN